MTTDNALRLFAKAQSDPDFFYRIALADPDERLRILRSEGWECTAEEIAEAYSHPYEAEKSARRLEQSRAGRAPFLSSLRPSPMASAFGRQVGERTGARTWVTDQRGRA